MADNRAWIDVHYHAMNEPYRKALADIGGVIRTPEWSRQKALDFSARQDIGTGILSLGVPGAHFGDDARARELAKRCNEDLADFVAQHPKRFGLFAITPMPDVEGACAVEACEVEASEGAARHRARSRGAAGGRQRRRGSRCAAPRAARRAGTAAAWRRGRATGCRAR